MHSVGGFAGSVNGIQKLFQYSRIWNSRSSRSSARILVLDLSPSRSRAYSNFPSAQISFPDKPDVFFDHPTGLFINNKFIESTGDEKLTTRNPATETDIATFPCANWTDVNAAVKAARSAFDSVWRHMSGTDRGKLLTNLSELLDQHKQYLGKVESLDTGKSIANVINEEIADCVNVSRYYGGWADKIYGQTIQPYKEKLAYTLREPYGVCGLIVPWNYPLMLSIWKLAPALAAGNTVVLKSSELTPLSASYLGHLITRAGFPPGVVNILSGGATTGEYLSRHPDVNKLSFTGSERIGKQIMRAAAENLVPVTLELGGKSAALVFDDADIEQAVKWCHMGVMSNAGQICTATSRIYIAHNIYEKFLRLLAEFTQVSSMKVSLNSGDFNQGPQISHDQMDKVNKYIQAGVSEGARLICGGQITSEKGYYTQATILADVKDNMIVATDEIFGPVVVCDSFSDTDEAVKRANSSSYGLAGAIFTLDITRALDVARRLEAGMIWINSSNDSDFRVPFGGYKRSGFGRELGEYALQAYTQEKAVHINMGVRL
ncbi:aldehyde dehydrogenase domain-containing protein [Kockiozyma suomiensis]|uniref:aldehyde dehydrogenase domain-containing protein n=1 Tax=Kockiozyma suomiensis TaxID=1337062 RepID=UPI0033431B59